MERFLTKEMILEIHDAYEVKEYYKLNQYKLIKPESWKPSDKTFAIFPHYPGVVAATATNLEKKELELGGITWNIMYPAEHEYNECTITVQEPRTGLFGLNRIYIPVEYQLGGVIVHSILPERASEIPEDGEESVTSLTMKEFMDNPYEFDTVEIHVTTTVHCMDLQNGLGECGAQNIKLKVTDITERNIETRPLMDLLRTKISNTTKERVLRRIARHAVAGKMGRNAITEIYEELKKDIKELSTDSGKTELGLQTKTIFTEVCKVLSYKFGDNGVINNGNFFVCGGRTSEGRTFRSKLLDKLVEGSRYGNYSKGIGGIGKQKTDAVTKKVLKDKEIFLEEQQRKLDREWDSDTGPVAIGYVQTSGTDYIPDNQIYDTETTAPKQKVTDIFSDVKRALPIKEANVILQKETKPLTSGQIWLELTREKEKLLKQNNGASDPKVKQLEEQLSELLKNNTTQEIFQTMIFYTQEEDGLYRTAPETDGLFFKVKEP